MNLGYGLPRVRGATLQLTVQNLLNETYASRATYGQEFGNVTPLHEKGRSFLLSVKATF